MNSFAKSVMSVHGCFQPFFEINYLAKIFLPLSSWMIIVSHMWICFSHVKWNKWNESVERNSLMLQLGEESSDNRTLTLFRSNSIINFFGTFVECEKLVDKSSTVFILFNEPLFRCFFVEEWKFVLSGLIWDHRQVTRHQRSEKISQIWLWRKG